MSVMMLRPKIKAGHGADVEAGATAMFKAIDEIQPDGVRYASCKLADGETFVVLLEVEEGFENPLPNVPAFLAFQKGLKNWIAEPAAPEWLTVVGSYRLF